jgi:hypothetical protein
MTGAANASRLHTCERSGHAGVQVSAAVQKSRASWPNSRVATLADKQDGDLPSMRSCRLGGQISPWSCVNCFTPFEAPSLVRWTQHGARAQDKLPGPLIRARHRRLR